MVRYFLGSALQGLSVESFGDIVGTRSTFRTVEKLQSKGPAAPERPTEFILPLLEHLDVGVSVLAFSGWQICILTEWFCSYYAGRFAECFYFQDSSYTHLRGWRF